MVETVILPFDPFVVMFFLNVEFLPCCPFFFSVPLFSVVFSACSSLRDNLAVVPREGH